jgi:hypothetical protein
VALNCSHAGGTCFCVSMKTGPKAPAEACAKSECFEAGQLLFQEGGRTDTFGVPHKTKGELLVLLTSRDLSRNELRKKLFAAGVPILWIPREIRRVAQIPTLSTAKIDLTKCRELAMGR